MMPLGLPTDWTPLVLHIILGVTVIIIFVLIMEEHERDKRK
jgi:hypothetical protein